MSDDSKRPILVLLTSHWVSMLGSCAGNHCWLLLAVRFADELRGHTSNPYIGIVVFLLIPVIFVLGLVLIALGFSLRGSASDLPRKNCWAAADRRDLHSETRNFLRRDHRR